MRFSHIISSTRIVAREHGLRHLGRISSERLREFARVRKALRSDSRAQAACLEGFINKRYEFDHVAVEPAEIEACDASVLRLFLFRRYGDLVATDPSRIGSLDQLAVLLVCDALYRTWNYRKLANVASAVRQRMTNTAWAKRVDTMLRRAQISCGELAAGEQGLFPHGGGSLADALLRGDVWNASGRMEWATQAYRRAVEIEADNPMARLHLGFHLLKKGEIAEGLVCWGLAERVFGHFPLRYRQPLWRGEPLGTKSLLIVFEHGFGDMIQFARYLAPLRRRAPDAALVALVPAPIVSLLARSFPDVSFVPKAVDGSTDFYVTATQMPLVLGGSVYEPRRYLVAHASDPRPTRPDRFRVGICWRGHPRQYEQSRSIAVEAFSTLFTLGDVEFVALLNTITPAEQAHLARFPNVTVPPIRDFASLADEIAACDLVVTVDTSIVHLAGALGTRTVLLSRPDACWRWGAAGRTSQWYDDVTIVRHPLDLDWPHVLAEARSLIESVASAEPVPLSAIA